MSEYSMPSYFQSMPVIGKDLSAFHEDNAAEIQAVEQEIHEIREAALEAGKSTEALNELAILRDRFGGQAAKAAIVTSQRCRSITRHRAAKLHIDVIELDDLLENRTVAHILSMMQKNSGA